jgi:hypothetical protein
MRADHQLGCGDHDAGQELAVLEDGEVLGTVEPLRISRADAEAMRKDDHLKAAFVERHPPHLGAKRRCTSLL